MTSRDLFLRRSTDTSGNTRWEQTPIISAALRGEMVVLDGIHRIDGDAVSALQQLACDREVHLADGSRLLRWDR